MCTKKLQPSNSPDPSFDSDTATNYFIGTYSDSTVTYGNKFSDWTYEFIPAFDHYLTQTIPLLVKLFHKIVSHHLEMYSRANNIIDTSVQKGFVTGLPGVFEHIYSLSAIMEDALANKKPLMMTFLDLKNTFGSISHQLIFDMLEAVKVPPSFIDYVKSFYSQLFVIIKSKSWETNLIPFKRGVFRETCSLL